MKTNNHRSNNNTAPEHTIQEYLAIIVRGKWIVLSVFGVVFVLTVIVTKLTDPVYQSTAQVLINAKEVQSSLFMDVGRIEGAKNVIQNELAILNSRSLADTVAKRLITRKYLDDAMQKPIPITQVAKGKDPLDSVMLLAQVSSAISGAIDFDPVRDSDIIKITAKSKDPREAAIIATTFAESYRDRNIYMSRTKTRSFKEFLADQAREKRRALEETEHTLQSYMEKQGIVSLDDEAKKVIEQLSQLEARRDETDISLQQAEKTLSSYQEQAPQAETNAARVIGEANDPYIRLLQEQLAKLEVQRDVTVVQNPATVGREIISDKLKEIDAQINALRLKLQKRTDEFLQTLTPGSGQDAGGYLKSVKQKIIETQIDVQALQTKKKALEDVIHQYEGQFERIPKKNVQLAQLQRARMSTEKLYLMVEEKFNEANITEKSNIGYIEIVEPAGIPGSPASPKMLINLAIAAVLGLGLGLGVVFTKEYLDVKIYTPEEIKRRGFQTLTAIKQMDIELAGLAGQLGSAGHKNTSLDSHLITFSYPFSSTAETYRQLRTNLQFAKLDHPVQAILLTSPTPGEGKSTTASNLGIVFAQTGKKVLLIDADLRRPSIHTEFGLKPEPGLSELLLGKASMQKVLQKTPIENLSVIGCGGIPENPAEILGSDKMRDLIQQAKRDYEIILFDSSPVLAVTDPSVLSTLADGVIVVVSAGKSRAQELEQASELLERVGGKILGVVLNNFDPRRAYGILYKRSLRGNYGYARTYENVKSNGEDDPAKKPQHQN